MFKQLLILSLIIIGILGCSSPPRVAHSSREVATINTDSVAALVSEMQALRDELRNWRNEREFSPFRIPGDW